MGITAASLARFGSALSANLVDAFPGTCAYGGVSYACAWVPGPKGREAIINGQAIRIEGAIRIPYAVLALATPPAERGLIAIDGKTYRIVSVLSRPHEGSHYLDLEQAGR